jgi:hypothetical protein
MLRRNVSWISQCHLLSVTGCETTLRDDARWCDAWCKTMRSAERSSGATGAHLLSSLIAEADNPSRSCPFALDLFFATAVSAIEDGENLIRALRAG